MSIFGTLKKYAGSWTVKSSVELSKELGELAAHVESIEVVPSEYGMSCKFNFDEGYSQYIPVSTECKLLEIGECPAIENLKVLTLGRPGDADIYRIDVK